MKRTGRPTIAYNVELIVSDMTALGWMATDLAKASGRSDSAIGRFLDGSRRTARIAKSIADAFQQPVSRYVLTTRQRRGQEQLSA